MTSANIATLERLSTSLKNLIKIQIDLFPEGIDEEFDQDTYLIILDRADQHVSALQDMVEGMLR